MVSPRRGHTLLRRDDVRERATITLNGTQKHSDALSGCCGWVFAGVEHAELEDRTPARRHFIEAFTWNPEREGTWTLIWRVFEVVRTDLVGVTAETLMTMSAPEPPPNGSLNLSEMAHLHVNDEGDAEWEVRQGTSVRKDVIETAAEKQQIRAKEEARKAAEARVDWSRVLDVRRPPTFNYQDADGCGHALVFGWSADRSELIAVQVDQDQLGLSNQPKSFDLGLTAGIDVRLHIYSTPRRSWAFCTDVGGGALEEETYRTVGGTITISVAPAFRKTRDTVTIQIAGAEFVSASGARVTQSRPVTLTAPVGRIF